MAPEDAARTLRTAAEAFSRDQTEIVSLWRSFDAYELCLDEPLSGDYLALFQALEQWESSSGDARDVAVEAVRSVCRRLSDHT